MSQSGSLSGGGSSSGNSVLIQTRTASASSSLIFTDVTGYDIYYLDFYGVTIPSDGVTQNIQFSTNNGSSYNTANYYMTGTAAYGNTLVAFNLNPGDHPGVSFGYNCGDSAVYPLQGRIYLYNFNSSTFYKNFLLSNTYAYAGNGLATMDLGGACEITTACNALKIIPESGTITTGTFKLYGIKN